MKPRFVHLHAHSHYSLLTALPKIPDLIEAAQKDGMPALALTDNGNLYGALPFYKMCRAQGIKPILGIDAYMALRSRHDKEAGVDNKRYRLILLAKNEGGYKNLIQLVTASHLEGFYYKPRIDRELLTTYRANLIVIIPSFSGEISSALKSNNVDKATELLSWYRETFAKDDVYLEVTHHPEIEGHQNLMERVRAFAKQHGVPLVAAHDVYYLKPEDRFARETLLKIQTNAEFAEGGGFTDSEEDFSFIGQKIAEKYFQDEPEALENTLRIADKCNVELMLGSWVFPNVKLSSGRSYDEELRELVYKGIPERNLELTPDVKERIEYELKVIKDKGYASYFLVVGDLMHYAHKHNILTTIRGSVAGSLVTYLANITNVNPIEYKLPFERFLNPERPSAPDIDMDFADNRRDEMIQYAKDTYGDDKVAQIGTFGTMMARGVVRDVARALGHPYAIGDRIARLIPIGSQGFPMTIKRAMEMTPELKELYAKDDDVKGIVDLSKKIEGNARHISIHAAGVVISPEPLTNFVPLQYDPKGGKIVTQYDMHAVEDAGLLKFDFLGIKNLSILADSVKRTKERHNISIDIESIPLDDRKTFEMLARGETMGLFQLNGSGMTRFLKELRPTTIHDINVMVALYRPGPMDNINEYMARKHGKKPTKYLHLKMKDFLEPTYGVLVYQDDLLMTAIEVAGYSWGEVDKFRKAVGKKIPAEMAKQHLIFVDGCQKHGGMSKSDAEKIWKLFEPFQGYGFNKAHAVSYGKVAYQTAYMKANYPVEYMAALLTSDAGNVEKIAETIIECERMGISVLPPDINESYSDFTIVENESGKTCIRFGLYSIKNFGEGITDTIISERTQNGTFTSLANFLERIQNRNLNRKSLEALIKCGTLDEFGDRATMLANINSLLIYNKESGSTPSTQDSLFGNLAHGGDTIGLVLEEHGTASKHEQLTWEKELLGLYISGHPLDAFRNKLEKREHTIAHIRKNLKEGIMTVAAGIIEEIRPVITKSGARMAFLKLTDFTGTIEVVFFPKTFDEYKDILQPEACLAIKGRVSHRNGEISLVGEAVKSLSMVQASQKIPSPIQ